MDMSVTTSAQPLVSHLDAVISSLLWKTQKKKTTSDKAALKRTALKVEEQTLGRSSIKTLHKC